jgi:DNA helicase-4
LLAFNNRAADEMKRRLAKTLGANLPHVMTFHALAHALVGPQKLLIEDRSTDQPGRSREVQKVIDQLVRSADHERLIRAVMLAHFREESEPSADERSDLTMQEYLAYRRALPRESLNGDYVKSSGEKIIANALFEHSIQYEYERPYPWGDGMYRPDFTVFGGSKRNVIIEYFGLKGDADYDEQSRRKQEFWATRREVFLDFSPKHLATRGQDEFVQFLLQKLHALGITYLRRSDDEIWQIIKRKALCQFTMAMQDFIARCRTLNLNPSALHTMVRLHASSSTAEAGFLEIAIPLYEGYLERLAAEKTNDFDGLIWHAASHIRGGSTAFVRDAGRNAATLAS